ncbi:nucleotidyl transferase AbiEii/AbiGii toxin family protein [Candidatus Saganbacteria bacterium]|nr:nucleotidyl transferase AbiEii/AbiGii toxin family protein [Candidatus Saganbacteria bacterium]
MEQAILTPSQNKFIDAVSREQNLANFYLSGGTALSAYYLNHRLSDDLDFFTSDEPDKISLHGFAKKMKTAIGAASVRFERLYDRNLFFFKMGSEELKVEFSRYPFAQFNKPEIKDGIKIDSLRDISANKLMALLDRFDPKDFVDLYFILKTSKLENIRKDAEKKFAVKISSLFLGGELAKVKRIVALPKMIKQITIEELKHFFSDQAEELRPNIIE